MRSKLGACILRVERSMVGKCMHVLPYCTSMFVELTGFAFLLHVFNKLHAPPLKTLVFYCKL